ncbi:hypothetical protein [Streptomyces sp. NPDC017940]|uniref:hypothetical protein n=1 Tax=Streptomyces sp. NPDC017940 TaxID=3365017 RepID=UPI00378B41A0
MQQIGLVGPEGELSPLLREFLTALARPLVLVQAEVTGQHGSLAHGVVVAQDAVFSHDAWPGEEESEYVPIEPGTLVWEMARKVKLRRGERPRRARTDRARRPDAEPRLHLAHDHRVGRRGQSLAALGFDRHLFERAHDALPRWRASGRACCTKARSRTGGAAVPSASWGDADAE